MPLDGFRACAVRVISSVTEYVWRELSPAQGHHSRHVFGHRLITGTDFFCVAAVFGHRLEA
jgi:hypothetical protein